MEKLSEPKQVENVSTFIIEREIEFVSEGTICRGLFVRPDTNKPAPLIVLVHGLGGVYEMRLDSYARTFAAAGYAALTFDYRYFGRSDGNPRHLLEREYQQKDIDNSIAFGKALEGVDASKVILWGTSLGGGNMIDVSSRRKDIAASIVQGPFTDGLASAMKLSVFSLIEVSLIATVDLLSRLVGRPPVLVPLAGTYGTPALMTSEDTVQSVIKLFPRGSLFSGQLSKLFNRFAKKKITLTDNVNTSDLPEKYPISKFTGSVIFPSGTVLITGVSALFGLKIILWRPGKNLKKLSAPMFVCVCETDSVAPAKPTIKYASAAPMCEYKVYPYGHFDIYTDEPFEIITRDQLEFLKRVVPC
jgi:uncharacterized protein